MALTAQQQADGIVGLDAMPKAFQFDGEYIQLLPESVPISGSKVTGKVRRDVGGENDSPYYRDIVVITTATEEWSYYRYTGPGRDAGEEIWVEATE